MLIKLRDGIKGLIFLITPMPDDTLVVKGAQMAQMEASDWSSDVMTGSGMGYR